MKHSAGRGSAYEIRLSESETATYYNKNRGTRYKSLISKIRGVAQKQFGRYHAFPFNMIPVYDSNDNLIIKVERPGGPI